MVAVKTEISTDARSKGYSGVPIGDTAAGIRLSHLVI
jgi:hypothetical protein